MSLHLHGLGHFHPENELTNAFFEELDIGTNDVWIRERVGIRCRRTVLPLDYIRETKNRDPRAALEVAKYSNAELGQRAALLALERAGIDKNEIGLVIAGSSAVDTVSPAEACNIARALEIDVPAFDINSACTSFLAQIYCLSLMRPEALPPYVLVVAPDALTRTVDYTDRSAAVLWGDAAAAAVISAQIPGRAQILGNHLASRPSDADKVVVPRIGHFYQQGRTVQMFAIRKTSEHVERLREEFEDSERRFHFVGHQANMRMLEAVCRQCNIPDERHHSNVEWYGNTAAASSASVISMNWDKWGPSDDIAVVGVGSGLTWASYLLRFGETP